MFYQVHGSGNAFLPVRAYDQAGLNLCSPILVSKQGSIVSYFVPGLAGDEVNGKLKDIEIEFVEPPQRTFCHISISLTICTSFLINLCRVWFLSACAYIPTAREVGLIIQGVAYFALDLHVDVYPRQTGALAKSNGASC